jgi:hypothetical protein
MPDPYSLISVGKSADNAVSRELYEGYSPLAEEAPGTLVSQTDVPDSRLLVGIDG